MPRLLYTVLAEKVIIAKDDTASLITVFHGLQLGTEEPLPDTTDLTDPVPLAIEWVAFSAWLTEEEEQGKSFAQRTAVRLPNTKTLLLSIHEFSIEARVHRTVIPFYAFPFIGFGVYEVSTAIREVGSKTRWIGGSTVPIIVRSGITS